MTTVLPSWTAGSTRDGLLAFLGAAESLPPERRVAVLDNDGTLWCERPNYAQLDFMVAVLADAVVAEPALSSREEYAAILGGDRQAMGAIGLHRLAHALAELCAGMEPEAFAERARQVVLTLHPSDPGPALRGHGVPTHARAARGAPAAGLPRLHRHRRWDRVRPRGEP